MSNYVILLHTLIKMENQEYQTYGIKEEVDLIFQSMKFENQMLKFKRK